jgi:hypothetical protein
LKQIAGRAFNFYARAGARRSSSSLVNGDRLYKVPKIFIITVVSGFTLKYYLLRLCYGKMRANSKTPDSLLDARWVTKFQNILGGFLVERQQHPPFRAAA